MILRYLEQEMLNNSNYFKDYVAASPSLHYCNNYLMKQFNNIVGNDNSKQQTLFLTFGAREDTEDGTGIEGMDNFNSFVQLLSDVQFHNIKVTNEIYSSFGHMETAIPTFTQSLKGIK